MKNKANSFCSISLVIATILLSAQGAQAANADDKPISNVTSYDDGIKISEFTDNTGFKVEGAGVVFTYNKETKVMSCSKVNGLPMAVSFDGSN